MQSGIKLPMEATIPEVARFVWKQERLNDYKKHSWESLREQWNEEHLGHQFKTYNGLHKYFDRGNRAVK